MRIRFPSDACKEPLLSSINPQAWLQVERGKLSKLSPQSPSSIDTLVKVPDPPILPLYKPVDYVKVLAQIHEELESCPPSEKSSLYLLQYHVFKGLRESKLMRRSLHSAYLNSSTVYEKLIFGAWLKYEKKQGEEIISELLSSCGKCKNEFGSIDIASEFPKREQQQPQTSKNSTNPILAPRLVSFQIGDEKVICERRAIAELSLPFHAMLNGCFTESFKNVIDLSENNISPLGMRAINDYCITGGVLSDDVPHRLLLEILVFANRFCCEGLKDACDKKLASLVSSSPDAIELVEFSLDHNSPVLAASCLQAFLLELPTLLEDERVVRLLTGLDAQQRSIIMGPASFSLYSLLSEVSLDSDSSSNTSVLFLKQLADCAVTGQQKMIAFHQLGCVHLMRKEYEEAERLFEAALTEGHIYSVSGLARIAGFIRGRKDWAHEKITSVIITTSCAPPLGWMHQERSLYCDDDDNKFEELDRASELDPTLTYPYMYRAAFFMRKHDVQSALDEINRVLGFKLALECLELRFCFYLALEDYQSALCDVQAILTLCPGYRMLGGRVAAKQLRLLVREHVEKWTTADCWLQLYDKWSLVDDIGSLSVIYQMLESDAAKGVLYFRQSLLLLRLNCPEAAMRSLQLARQHASSEPERLVYEGWILYDTGHCEEGLQKAEESINLQRSFEAFFLKAYALADSSQDPSCSSTVVSLLEEALKCPSDRLRKGQALNNLGSVYVDCGKLDAAADCYINALKIRHTRAHQGLARVHFLRNDKNAAYAEMTKLIEKARNNASAYEKRSEYCERDLTKADLEMVTRLDPLRVYPYRYRAAVLMDNHKEKEAIAELSRAIAFKADLHLLHLRAAFHEHIGDVMGALRDCRAALSVDPNHQEMLELHSRVNTHEP
ncbi:ETO1-like 1 [Striga asiatica]|uniref:ETO1-like 1 n=1 Tax=Striga asiatica TaxID=4170 RepID=A0A5A7NWJ0_STRAF|nr:ETO1-like 1 [Striga asiatica]